MKTMMPTRSTAMIQTGIMVLFSIFDGVCYMGFPGDAIYVPLIPSIIRVVFTTSTKYFAT